MVVDASAAVELLLRTSIADAVEPYVFSGAAAPDLLNAEAIQTLRTHERRGRIDAARSRQALDDLLALPITRYPSLQLLERAWTLRHNFTAYDGMYVALAEALNARLVTADEHLARAVHAHTAIEVVLVA